MRRTRPPSVGTGLEGSGVGDTDVLDGGDEREMLRTLDRCKYELAAALASIAGTDPPAGADDPRALAQYITHVYHGDSRNEARLGVIFHRYSAVRTRIALANLRLVAHVAKGFRERGISYADLIQEGFCGLLEAIDRFEVSRETKLATYATWWIRQAMQRAVAAGAYPVRLSHRHLRQLAQSQDDNGGPRAGGRDSDASSSELIDRIRTATRPTVSLQGRLDARFDATFTLLQVVADPEGDRTDEVDLDETMDLLLGSLNPRERHVLALRFGFEGPPGLSLSEAGKVLGVSKERVRQIQDRALAKLRAVAEERHLDDLLTSGA